ncbi:MBOAT family O-acyltransferase [Flammeovirgaceae bacterium SG7u.111]|nr:MBOAT family O-acyltransferase [Flammeovirgaceae bacterium SG7u.132]WPO33694.1 MBOAT family O-acyltransferase [Flammeovirgaceae bacterium SG7u.111]
MIIVNYLLSNKIRNSFLLLVSLFFYAWGEGILVLVMLGSIYINYIAGVGISELSNKKIAKIVLALAICANLSILFYFKYSNFFIDNLSILVNFENFNFKEILLPIGISFFTFQGISYLIDVFRNDTKVQKNPIHLGLYISLFPQLIAGPIVRYHDIAMEIENRKIDLSMFSDGLFRFIRGLSKKVLIANSAALIADKAFEMNINELPTLVSWLGIICYALQIYFDFSGYSDMAIGLGKILGFNFKENFNYPYISRSIQDFWRRWHISLSTWFRDYLYISLGGNRLGKWITYRNLFIVFLVTGLWHGASWNFIVWGLFHGLFLILERNNIINVKMFPRFIQHIYLLLVVLVAWVFFRTDNLLDSIYYLSTMIGFNNGNNYEPIMYLTNYTLLMLLTGVIFVTPIRLWLEMKLRINFFIWKRLNSINLFLKPLSYLFLLILVLVELAQSSYNPFIYFRF